MSSAIGRPTKWNPDNVRVAESMCKLGATDFDVAEALGVNKLTIYRWQARYPEFYDAMKLGKEVADEKVKKALYSLATGYKHEATDIRVADGQVVETPVIKEYAPNITAIMFWLSNRLPDEFRKNPEQDTPELPEININIVNPHADDKSN